MSFYFDSLQVALNAQRLTVNDKILVIGGGQYDRDTLHRLGFKNVLITNLSPHDGQRDYSPYEWQYEDAENLTFLDESFDWVIEHAALHHLGSPHRGVLEMMRVARKGIIAFEARDSTLMRLAVALGLTLNYELEPAFLSQGGAGGYRNSPIPNFVTRWRECEIEKLIYSMYPAYKHDFRYFYGLSVPVQRFRMARSVIYRSIGMVLSIASGFLGKIIGKQGNSFGFLIQKNISLQPWIKQGANGALVPDVNFLAAKYDRSKYKRVA